MGGGHVFFAFKSDDFLAVILDVPSVVIAVLLGFLLRLDLGFGLFHWRNWLLDFYSWCGSRSGLTILGSPGFALEASVDSSGILASFPGN
jgi:hypothetical protein